MCKKLLTRHIVYDKIGIVGGMRTRLDPAHRPSFTGREMPAPGLNSLSGQLLRRTFFEERLVVCPRCNGTGYELVPFPYIARNLPFARKKR